MSIGHWEPFWIGEPERQRYAALHRASSPDARVGVVMVPPLFYEQPRGRRFTTEAASALAGLGMPTLRFDFFGEGDSAGSAAEMDVASMREDISDAVEARSEEHTSELQSLMRISYAVFCLKKKTTMKKHKR